MGCCFSIPNDAICRVRWKDYERPCGASTSATDEPSSRFQHTFGCDRQTSYGRSMLRPASWTELAGGSPVPVGTGAPGSRPRFVVETRRAERGVESLFGGSKCAGRSATWRESCSFVRFTTKEPSRSCHGEGHARRALVRGQLVGSFRGTGSGTCTQSGSEQERPVWHAYVRQETKGISRW